MNEVKTLKDNIKNLSQWIYENDNKWYLHIDKYIIFIADLCKNYQLSNIDELTEAMVNAGNFINALNKVTSIAFMNFNHYASTITNLTNFYNNYVYLANKKIYLSIPYERELCIGKYTLIYTIDGQIVLNVYFNS